MDENFDAFRFSFIAPGLTSIECTDERTLRVVGTMSAGYFLVYLVESCP